MGHDRFFHLRWLLRYLLFSIILLSLAVPQSSASAAASLTITPITWNVIGLDSNNVNVGPNDFPVGAHVCNYTGATVNNVTSSFVWDTTDSFINLRPGTLTSFTGSNAVTSLANNDCIDFYYEVEITRNNTAYTHKAQYHITATADTLTTASTPTPRELYVEYLVSQSRNGVRTVEYGTSLGSMTSVAAGGTMTLVVGSTYYIRMSGFTATNGYEQIESFINIPNTIFQVLNVQTQYNVDTSAYVSNPNDKLYADACHWENDITNVNYRSCLDVGKDGGDPITVTYQVKILKVPTAPLVNPEPLTNLIYDFSGSSYHYNSDFSVSTRYANIISPATISKSFSPNTISANGTSTLTYTITNISSSALSNVNFADTTNWPSGLSVSGNQTITYNNCGSPTPSTVSNGATSFSVSGITLAASGTCTFSFLVTSSVDGTYTNTTNDLFIDTADTGNKASASLVVSSLPSPPSSCTTPSTIATWTMPTSGQGSGGPPPPYTTKDPDVSSASASATLTGSGLQSIIAAGAGGTTNAWNITDAFSTLTSPPGVASGPYFQFALDTSNYGGAHISFDFDLEANGDWASNTNNHIYIYSSADGTTFSLVRTLGNADGVVKGSWVTGVASATATSTSTSTTYFRITADSRSGTQATSSVRLDNITITGCPRPTPPTLAKSFSPTSIGTDTTVSPATTVNYSTLTYTIGNTNTSALTGVAFTDTLPDGIVVANPPTVSAFSCTSGTMTGTVTATAGSSTISLSSGSLPAGTSTTCTFSVRVQGKIAGSYTNTTNRITAAESGANTSGGVNVGYGQASLTVVAAPVIAKSFTANPIFTSNTTTLTFSINNPNTSTTLNGISFTDTLPLGLDVVAAAPSAQCGGTLTVTNNISPTQDTIVLSGGSLTAGNTCYFNVTVTGTTAGLYNNSVTVSSTNGGTGNTSTASVLVKAPSPGINLLKQVGTTSSGPWVSNLTLATGSNVYYRFIIENTGDVTLTSVSISDPTVSVAGCTWTDGDGTVLATPVSPPPFALPVADANDNQLATCVLGPFTAASGSNPNTATVSTTQGVSDTSTATYTGTGPNLSLAKTNGTTTVTAGGTTTYTLTVTNSGTSASSGTITIVDVLPTGLSIADGAVTLGGAQAGNWSCSAAGNVITCTSSTAISASGTSIFSFVVNVDATASGTLVNKAKVGGGGDPTNSSAPDSTSTSACTANDNPEGCALDSDTVDFVNLGLAKTDGVSSVIAGGTTTYTLTVTNSGNIPTSGTITVVDVLTVGLNRTDGAFTPGGANGANWSCSAASNVLTCTSSTAIAGSNGTSVFSFTVNVAANATGTLVNKAKVGGGGDPTNPNAPDNTSTGLCTANDNPEGCALDSDTVTTLIDVSLDKQVSDATPNVGDTVTFTLVIANAGPSTATNIVMTDVVPSGYTYVASSITGGDARNDSNPSTTGLTWTINSLANGASVNLTYQAQVLATGTYDNYAEITSHTETDSDSTPGNNSTTEDDDDTVVVTPTPVADLAITKTDGVTSVSVGGSTTYTVRVTNNGPSSVTGAILSDPAATGLSKTAVVCSAAVGNQCVTAPTISELQVSPFFALPALASGEFYEITVTADVTAFSGSVTNTATVAAPSGTVDSDNSNNSASDTDTVAAAPSMTVVKSSTTASLSAPGTVNYSYLVTNTGNVTLTGISLSDDNDNNNMSCPGTSLAPSASMTCSATHTFTQAQLDANGSPTAASGNLTNNVTASSNEAPDATDSLDIPIIQSPAMTVAKSSTTTSLSAPGTVTYSYLVTNTGNVTLTGIGLSDDNDNNDLSCPSTTLAPSATMTCTATHTFTQAELNANGSPTAASGNLTNNVTASSNEAPDATDTLNIPIIQNPAMTVAKSSTTTGLSAPQSVTYSYLVTNTGNVTLTGIGLSDNNDNNDMSCPFTTLAPSATMTCSATHTFTQAELNAGGSLDNTVTASSNEAPDATDSLSIPITQNAAMTVAKSSTTTSLSAPATVNYSYLVTNTGNVTLTGISLSDDNDNNNMSCPSTTLAPSASMTCTATHTFTQAEMDANGSPIAASGNLTNNVTASSNEAPDATDSLDIPITQNAAMTVAKSSTTASLNAPATVNYSYLVTNTGNVTLTGISLSDDNDNNNMSCPSTTLAPSATMTCSATHTFTQAELDANGSPSAASGNLTNNVTASSNEAPDATDSLDIPITQNAAMTVAKSSTTTNLSSAPQTVTYSYLVTNTGNVTLTGISLSDDNDNNDMSCPATTLLVGANMTCSATHSFTQAELDAGGSLDNTVTASSNEAPDATDSLSIPITNNPAINVTKTITTVNFVSPSVITLTYSIVVQNTGNTDLTNVQVVDDLTTTFPSPATYVVNSVSSGTLSVNSGFNGNSNKNLLTGTDTLAPTASGTITLVVTVTTNGGDASYTNTATASGKSGTQTVTDFDSASGPSFIDPALTKSVDPSQAGIGDTVTFTITVTNNGTVDATGVVVTDPLPDNLDYVSATSSPKGTVIPPVLPSRTVQVNIGTLTTSDVVTITIVTTVNGLGQPPIQNRATVVADAPPPGVSPDPTQNNAFTVTLSVTNPGGGGGGGGGVRLIPVTGFAPNVVTTLPPQPVDKTYSAKDGVWLEIPRLGLQMPIVGIPASNGTWDVTWLSNQAGWLTGTAFPTWNGNSVLTSHVYLANGLPGPFVDLHTLKWGDKIIIHAFGQRYIYEVRSNRVVLPNDLSVLQHEDNPWLTLLTCKDYDQATNSYAHRVAISAVLVTVEEDHNTQTGTR